MSDMRNLAGATDAIFVGRVLIQIDDKSLGSLPETQYRVQVVDSLKGDAREMITVNQQGGHDNVRRALVVVNGDEPLVTGKHYLFATKYLPAENWYTLVPNFGDRPLDDNVFSSGGPEPKIVTDMRDAIANQIPYPQPR
ncbi:hypothetical protein [Jongsikchunia kroppenstedtii]|uniref:hypothetical protein n=1 Tax=Jongsikchunia kroppenstedtii TaxID=1121721 RepID=UPI0012DEB0EE|nr:hypothetical protein [Jongsikchunia kroppenstedtii]